MGYMPWYRGREIAAVKIVFCSFFFSVLDFIDTIIPLALIRYEMIMTTLVPRILLAIYDVISNSFVE